MRGNGDILKAMGYDDAFDMGLPIHGLGKLRGHYLYQQGHHKTNIRRG
jgi:hypothetical protein